MSGARAAIAGAAALLVALSLWMVVQVREAAQPAGSAVVLRRVASAAVPAAAPASIAPASIALPRPLAPPAAALSEPDRDGVRVCGLGTIELPVPSREAEAAVAAALLAPHARSAREHLLATLDASTDEHDQALGHYIALALDEGPPERRDELATLALHTRDPRVYRLALAACPRTSAQPSQCERLSIAQWARLDPDNAVPWLHLAQEAERRGDTATVEEALFRASRARTSDADRDGALQLLQRASIAALPTPQRIGLAANLHELRAAMPLPGLKLPLEHCGDAQRDANRQQLCSDLAALFVERDTTLAGFTAGVRLAEYAGWPDERRQRLADEREALGWANAQHPSPGAHALDCDTWRRHERWSVALAADGEIGALRRAIVDSERGIAELAGTWRAARRAGAAPR